MKQLFLFLLLISFSASAQNFSKVDKIIDAYPHFSQVEQLANQIEKDFNTDLDKARATFYWLAKNIRYNLRELYSPRKRGYRFSYATEEEKQQKLQAIKDKLVDDTFARKLGVCEEYAQSFKKVCDLIGVEAAVIKGYVRNDASEIGKIPNSTNHAWNAVKIEGNWLILDATWAAGYEYNNRWVQDFNDYFFDMPASKMFKTHFPDDSLWVLRFGRIEIEDFYNQPIYSNTFLRLNAELISPQQGIIEVDSSNNIELKFKNLDTSHIIFYTYKGLRYAQKPVISKEEDLTTLSLKNPQRNTELVLFINKNDALHFKIKSN